MMINIHLATLQPTNCHQILIQMLLNPDWCTGLHDITLFQLSPALFKEENRGKKENLSYDMNQTAYSCYYMYNPAD